MTTPVSIPKLLKDFLDDLTEKRLREFQWHLFQIQIDGSKPILRSQLEKATREATVDKLVEVFGEEDAVERTVDTFFRMNLNDIAFKLIQAKIDQINQSKEQQVDEPGASSAREESGASSAREESGASSAREEPGASSAREEPREDDPTVPKGLSCSICLSLFTEPLMLQCGHSFCRTCVHEDWERKIIRECSLCKQFIPEGDPPINLNLKRNDTESCQTPPKNIKEKQEFFEKVKQLCDSSVERIKTQRCNTDNEIMDNFKILHALLDEEEKTRRAALKEEARQKSRMTHLIYDTIKNTYSLSDTIKEIRKFGADEKFILKCGTEMGRMERALLNLLKISQPWINMSKHLENLPLTVLENIGNNIKRTSVVLDPKTASSCPSVSDHQTKVKVNGAWQPFPGNPECSTRYQQDLQRSPKRMRLEQDCEIDTCSFHYLDNNTSILMHDRTFTQMPYTHFPEVEAEVEVEDEAEVEVEVEVEDEDEDEVEVEVEDEAETETEAEAGDEVEQGRAETFREEGAQS